MPMDTAEKRASAGAMGPIAMALPTPDATINAGDREQVAALYRGITDGSGGGPTTFIFLRPGRIYFPG